MSAPRGNLEALMLSGARLAVAMLALCFAAACATSPSRSETPMDTAYSARVLYRTLEVDGVRIFYREAGEPSKPTMLLLHGFSSSSHMYRDLIPLLAQDFHVIAPDYPGFGYSDAPDTQRFEPSFTHLVRVMERFVEVSGAQRFYLYMQDFGGPVGLRIAARHPDWVRGLIVQNANAYLEGLPQQQAQPGPMSARVVNAGFIQYMYRNGARDAAGLNPDAWTVDIAVLANPAARAIQSALIDDYHTNIALYPQWQAYFREHQPRTLVVWGRNDQGFLPAGAEAYLRDLRDVSIQYFETGHFALEEDAGPIAQAIIAHFAEDR